MAGWLRGAALVIVLGALAPLAVAQVRYKLEPIPLTEPGTVGFVEGLILTGSVTTDGSTGVLDEDSILGYSFTVEGPTGAVFVGPDSSDQSTSNGVSFEASERALRLRYLNDVELYACAPPGACEVVAGSLQSNTFTQGANTIGYGFLDATASLSDFALFVDGGWTNAAAVLDNDQPFAVNVDLVTGDYNDDGVADSLDAAVWASAFGSEVLPGESADGNWDGVVDASDYTIWRDAMSTSATPTPEPGTAVLALAALVAARLSGSVGRLGRRAG